jgi:hypothetical protein
MTNTIKISCLVGATDSTANLGLEIWVDDTKLYDNDQIDTGSLPVELEIVEDEADHELRFVMKNKTTEHTKVDEQGNILSDASLTVTDLAFDEIKLGYMLTEHAVYTHDFNGTGEETQDKFYGEMGCNGTVSLKFTTPIYLWLLEHM